MKNFAKAVAFIVGIPLALKLGLGVPFFFCALIMAGLYSISLFYVQSKFSKYLVGSALPAVLVIILIVVSIKSYVINTVHSELPLTDKTLDNYQLDKDLRIANRFNPIALEARLEMLKNQKKLDQETLQKVKDALANGKIDEATRIIEKAEQEGRRIKDAVDNPNDHLWNRFKRRISSLFSSSRNSKASSSIAPYKPSLEEQLQNSVNHYTQIWGPSKKVVLTLGNPKEEVGIVKVGSHVHFLTLTDFWGETETGGRTYTSRLFSNQGMLIMNSDIRGGASPLFFKRLNQDTDTIVYLWIR